MRERRGFGGPIAKPLADRFWPKVKRGRPDECWPWQGAKTKGGYGIIGLPRIADKPHELAHRVAWMLTRGPIPNGLRVLHRCDNPPCCNPDHVFIGTAKDNTQDMLQKGRYPVGNRHYKRQPGYQQPRGIDCHSSKATDELVKEIRRMRDSQGMPYSTIGLAVGLSRRTISAICKRESWSHVD